MKEEEGGGTPSALMQNVPILSSIYTLFHSDIFFFRWSQAVSAKTIVAWFNRVEFATTIIVFEFSIEQLRKKDPSVFKFFIYISIAVCFLIFVM